MPLFYWILGASLISSLISLIGRSVAFLNEEKCGRKKTAVLAQFLLILAGILMIWSGDLFFQS